MHNTFILKLPDELLDKIICAAASIIRHWNREHCQVYDTAFCLSLVCRRFHRISMPYLYADLIIDSSGDGWKHPEQVPRHLHRSCRENPLLWTLCRSLTVYHQESKNKYLYAATDFVTWFIAVRSFTLYGLDKGERAWALLHLALEHMSSYTRLVLGSYPYSYSLDLPRVIDVLGDFETGPLQNLQTLGLKGISTHGDSLCQAKLKEKAGTAPFTKLKLRCFLLTPRTLEALVRWPKRLEAFELKFSFGDDYAEMGLYTEWTLAIFKQVLAIHRSTLRSIKLYAVGISGLAGFDLRDFESLEELSLSSACTGHQNPVRDHMIGVPTNLLAPRLRVFHWDLTLQDQQHCEGLDDFGQEEEDWLRALVREALARGCPLQRIEIEFTPDSGYGFNGIYPWDRMDALGADLRPYGIKVCYNLPSISREEFLDIMKDTKRWEEACRNLIHGE